MESHFLLPQSKLLELNNKLEEIKEAIRHPQPFLSDWVSEAQAQKLLGLKSTSLWSLRKRKQIRFSKIGAKIFYSLKSIEKFLEKNQN